MIKIRNLLNTLNKVRTKTRTRTTSIKVLKSFYFQNVYILKVTVDFRSIHQSGFKFEVNPIYM